MTMFLEVEKHKFTVIDYWLSTPDWSFSDDPRQFLRIWWGPIKFPVIEVRRDNKSGDSDFPSTIKTSITCTAEFENSISCLNNSMFLHPP